jgi:cyclophilin family peptidyl-prolyl cis-trans isomerase
MKTALLAMAGLLALAPAAWGEDKPRLAPERIVLRTVAGDIVLALNPEIAPRTVEQMIHLARLGVFDTTHFVRYEPGFVLQLSMAADRSPQKPLTAEQAAAIHPLKAEFSQKLKHRRGILSLAHYDNQPDSGDTSFSILLGDAPHLDGQYTIFGHVESGMDVVEEMTKVAQQGTQPFHRLEVFRADVADYPEALAPMNLTKAHPVPDIPTPQAAAPPATAMPDLDPQMWGDAVLAGGVLLAIAGSLVAVLFSKRLSPRVILSLHLITVLIGSFLILMLLVPVGWRFGAVAVGLFAGLLGLMKLMGRFESAG